jgi:hydroxyethylthiazole kinase
MCRVLPSTDSAALAASEHREAERVNHAQAAGQALERLRATRPLVHNITNFVAMDLSANALLAIGASPAMIHAVEESAEFTRIASALVINIGTLSSAWVTAMRSSAGAAREARKPWVLDPVGCGATTYRTSTALELATLEPAVIRGNASEIMALAGTKAGRTRGVDATDSSEAALAAARAVALEFGCVVGVTGRVDYVTDGDRVLAIEGSDEMLTRVTASGCALSAIVAAFLVVEPDALNATAYAFATFATAAERAARNAPGPGSARVRLVDELHALTAEIVQSAARIR